LSSNLRVENPFKSLPLFVLRVPPRATSTQTKLSPSTAIKILDKGKGIASEPPKKSEGKKGFNVMAMGTSKRIVLIEVLSPLERWKKFKLLEKLLVKRK